MKKYISSFLFLAAAMLWGFAFTAQKESEALSAFAIGAVRSFIATLFLFAMIPLLDKAFKNGRRLISKEKWLDINRTELIGGAVCGAILTVATAFQQTGLNTGTDAGKAAFITALYVLIVPIVSLLFGKRSPINVWISVGIAVVGFYLLCVKDDLTVLPSDALVLICAFIFSFHIIAIDHFSPKCDGVRMSCVQFFVAFVLNTICSLIFDGAPNFPQIAENLPTLAYLGVCSSGIAYTLQIIGQRDANPAVASIILSLESVFGVVGGAMFLGEAMSPREYIGCAIVFLAVILSQLDISSHKKRSSGKSESSDQCEIG